MSKNINYNLDWNIDDNDEVYNEGIRGRREDEYDDSMRAVWDRVADDMEGSE